MVADCLPQAGELQPKAEQAGELEIRVTWLATALCRPRQWDVVYALVLTTCQVHRIIPRRGARNIASVVRSRQYPSQ